MRGVVVVQDGERRSRYELYKIPKDAPVRSCLCVGSSVCVSVMVGLGGLVGSC
jgi:hypothetical protein